MTERRARPGSLRGPPGTILESLEDRSDTLRAVASHGAADLIASRSPPGHVIARRVAQGPAEPKRGAPMDPG